MSGHWWDVMLIQCSELSEARNDGRLCGIGMASFVEVYFCTPLCCQAPRSEKTIARDTVSCASVIVPFILKRHGNVKLTRVLFAGHALNLCVSKKCREAVALPGLVVLVSGRIGGTPVAKPYLEGRDATLCSSLRS